MADFPVIPAGQGLALAETATGEFVSAILEKRLVLDFPINVLDAPYNVANDGSANAAPGILAAVEDAWSANSQDRPIRSVYVPAGVYLIDSSLDFSAIPEPFGLDLAFIRGFSFVCDPNATFVMGTATNETCVFLGPPPNWNFIGCEFVFGSIIDPAEQTGNNGLALRSIQNSRIVVKDITGFQGAGVLGTPRTTEGIFNNYIDVRQIRDCGTGFATLGHALPGGLYGFQGNEVHFGQVAFCTEGIHIDANGVGRNSQWNAFHVAAAESNTTHAMIDDCGQNTWFVSSSTGNTGESFVLTTGAWFRPVVIGDMSDGVDLNGGKGTIINGQDAIDDVRVVCSSNQAYTSTSVVDVPGLTATVACPGTYARYLVSVSLDVETTSANTATFLASLKVDGSAEPGQIIFKTDENGARQPLAQTWLVDGIAAGNRVIKVDASLTGAGGYTVQASHSTMTVTRIG